MKKIIVLGFSLFLIFIFIKNWYSIRAQLIFPGTRFILKEESQIQLHFVEDIVDGSKEYKWGEADVRNGTRDRVRKYLNERSMIENNIANSLNNLTLSVGMDKEQVKVLVGPPNKVKYKGDVEIWIYKESDEYLSWFVFFAKLYFKNNSLIKIEGGQTDIPK